MRVCQFFLIVFIVISGINRSSGQNITVSVIPEYGSYSMSDLRALQNKQASIINDTLQTSPKTIYDFPSYWGFS